MRSANSLEKVQGENGLLIAFNLQTTPLCPCSSEKTLVAEHKPFNEGALGVAGHHSHMTSHVAADKPAQMKLLPDNTFTFPIFWWI